MKLFQRILSLLLIGCLVFSFAACGKKVKDDAAAGTTGTTGATQGADATQPTDGSGNATQPGDATQPTNPTQPGNPTQPTQPGNPTNPTQPSNPTNPTQPSNPTTPNQPTTPSQPTNPPVPSTPAKAPASLILNADGSFGGTLNKDLYGEGAPKNGQFNVANSAYYTVNNDYYNMTSTSERIIFPKFKSYQQTMQDSSGLACVLMILNYMGKDTKNTYTELALVKKYEEVNGTTVYGNGTTEEGLVKLVNSLGLGYTATNTVFKFSGSKTATRQDDTKAFFRNSIKEGKFVLVRYQSPVGNGWKLVAGYDTLGNVYNTLTKEYVEHFADDVVIFAEPNDGADHCQDGFTTERVQDFYVWWREMAIDGTVDESSKWSYVLIDPNLDITYDYQKVDETVKQKLYDVHLPLNPDGSYGGARNDALYGVISSGNGKWDHTESNYYKINDFYNMGSEGSRVLLKNYTVLQQTMSSSCGICATTSVLKYYGEDGNPYDMELTYVNDYERIMKKEIKGTGTTVIGLKKLVNEKGYTAKNYYTAAGSTPKYGTYEAYVQFIRENLQAGRPVVVCTYLGSGHFLTVIGYDDMGTDYIYDDVIIAADSCDSWDGYQDGYNVYSAYKFFRQHTNKGYTPLQSMLVIYKKTS